MIRGLQTIVKQLTRMKPKVVLVLGPPGSGKGTQCANIVNEYGYKHLSAGDLLREERSNPHTAYGKLIESYIKDGRIVPVEITCNLLLNAMRDSGKSEFVIDGFPRNQDNLNGWNKNMSDNIDLKFMIFLDCSLDVCKDRCLGRGAAGSGRTDDNLESLKKRFVTYENETKPIIDHFSHQDLVKCIDASKTPEEVFNEVKSLFSTLE